MKTKLLHQSLISCPHLNQNVQKRRFLLLAEDKMHSKAGKSFFDMGGHYQKSKAFSQRVRVRAKIILRRAWDVHVCSLVLGVRHLEQTGQKILFLEQTIMF